eukprot:PLAT5102.1.p1 GENE.PLAT5102.1~~PLAT5102.1.p1  ORF type:complete len:325 (-),score=96.51 PLAT5102.1:38-961(-)
MDAFLDVAAETLPQVVTLQSAAGFVAVILMCLFVERTLREASETLFKERRFTHDEEAVWVSDWLRGMNALLLVQAGFRCLWSAWDDPILGTCPQFDVGYSQISVGFLLYDLLLAMPRYSALRSPTRVLENLLLLALWCAYFIRPFASAYIAVVCLYELCTPLLAILRQSEPLQNVIVADAALLNTFAIMYAIWLVVRVCGTLLLLLNALLNWDDIDALPLMHGPLLLGAMLIYLVFHSLGLLAVHNRYVTDMNIMRYLRRQWSASAGSAASDRRASAEGDDGEDGAAGAQPDKRDASDSDGAKLKRS